MGGADRDSGFSYAGAAVGSGAGACWTSSGADFAGTGSTGRPGSGAGDGRSGARGGQGVWRHGWMLAKANSVGKGVGVDNGYGNEGGEVDGD